MQQYEMLKLENQLCFPLYAAAKEVVRLYTPFLNEIGLTYTQYVTMMLVWDKQYVSVKEIGARLYLDTGTLTPLLKRLEKSGVISLQKDKHDHRSVIVSVTEQGVQLREKAADIPMKIGQCISLPVEKIQILYTMLYDILNGIKDCKNKTEVIK